MDRDQLQSFRNKNVHIAGFSGAEGYAVLRYLYRLGFSRLTAHDIHTGKALFRSFSQSHISISRQAREAEYEQLMSLPVQFCLGNDYLVGIDDADLIFAGQNWFAHTQNKPISEARARGIPVKFLIQLYFDLSPAPIIAVTGTNGKTTVVNCLYHIMKTLNVPALLSGNDRYHGQVLDRLQDLSSNGFLILEVSNRQLLELNSGPYIAVLTNIQEDHIEEHGSFARYAAVKKRLFTLQKQDGWAVINADDPQSVRLMNRCPAQTIGYSVYRLKNPGAGPYRSGYGIVQADIREHLFSQDDISLPGEHNTYNILAAATAAYLAVSDSAGIRKAIQTFTGVRNRVQRIASVNGVTFFDDLASTNPSATNAALQSISQPVILIVGGNIKGNRTAYDILLESIPLNVKHVIALESDVGDYFIRKFKDKFSVKQTLSQAVDNAFALSVPGDAVLLSPAGSGFYSQFTAQKKGFRRLVRDIARKSKNNDD